MTENISYCEKLGLIKQEAEHCGLRALIDEPLSTHTSVKTGGPCDLMIFADDYNKASGLYKKCKDMGLYTMILGNGSNVLFSDDGFRGVIITACPPKEAVICHDCTITAAAGASLKSVCKAAMDNSLTGLEFAYGIPGTVGGAVYMNAGAYGSDMSTVLERVICSDIYGRQKCFTAPECGLGYRTSRFEGSGEIILLAEFKLTRGNRDEIHAKMEELIARRKRSQPLEYPSFGSAFKRPEGSYAGLVIEQSGLKGYTVGRAQISPKHANFIINLGGATSRDIMELIDYTQKTVFEKTGFRLEPEVRLIPAEPIK